LGVAELLALVGSGEYLPGMEDVDLFLLGTLGEAPRVVCLPTAAGTEGPERIAYWSDLGTAYFSRMGAEVEALPLLTHQDAMNESLVSRIARANLVYLSGGKPDYLLSVLKGSLAWEAILQVLTNGGVLVGCSAGAMVQGGKIPGFPGWRQGLGLLSGTAVMPHFEEIPSWMVRMLHLWLGSKTNLVGIEGYTALVVDGSQAQVVGAGGVMVWGKAAPRRYVNGDRVPI